MPKDGKKPTQIESNVNWANALSNEAQFPRMGLPVKWDKTQKRHARTIFIPEKNTTINIKTKETKHHTKSPIAFITATKEQHSLPGANKPACARVQRFQELQSKKLIIEDADGSKLAPCMAHGDYVKVESLAGDHAQSAKDIFARQIELIEKLNADAEFASFIMKQPGMGNFFIEYENKYYGSLYFYELYYNDINNIWLICGACNIQKGSSDIEGWLRKNPQFSKEFLEYLNVKQDTESILLKNNDGKGLAAVLIDWYWERHNSSLLNLKRILTEIVAPLKLMNKKIDQLDGEGNQARTKRKKANLEAKCSFLEAVVNAPRIGLPLGDAEQNDVASSSDEEDRMTPVKENNGQMKLDISPNTYAIAVKETAKELKTFLRDAMKKNIRIALEAKEAKNKESLTNSPTIFSKKRPHSEENIALASVETDGRLHSLSIPNEKKGNKQQNSPAFFKKSTYSNENNNSDRVEIDKFDFLYSLSDQHVSKLQKISDSDPCDLREVKPFFID